MKSYELTYLISSEMTEEETKSFPEKIAVLIQESEGIVGNKSLILKRKLAYPIKKQGEAYLAVITFQLNADKLTELEKKLKSENKILRYLLTVKKPVKETRRTVRKITQLQEKKKKKAKVELKEIEKKLEEILKE